MRICDKCKKEDKQVFDITIPCILGGQYANMVGETYKELCLNCIRKLVEIIEKFIK